MSTIGSAENRHQVRRREGARGEHIEDPSAWAQTPEARQFMTESGNACGTALAAAGAADGEVATAIENTTNFYAPTPAEAQDENAGT